MLPVVFAGVLSLSAAAIADAATEPSFDEIFSESGEQTLEQFIWEKRPLVIFADSASDPRFIRQMESLHARPGELAERDVVVITDTDPAGESPLRQKLRPRGFMLVLVGKDGQIKLRKPQPWDVREISHSIDKTPLRQDEIRERRALRNAGQ
ncbi:DUF4174 domain-containing protein [Pseudooceanicola sp. 216_PA32_1]|uniref:DUF4174 domain-containing protein n=2 Tax=Pseudooceanicola pacificus TaxID=2676438 RepID=A0A844WA98_9RHOB|nr:DUF4174 domain-containing protein [Pseudooceanicola pacificus]